MCDKISVTSMNRFTLLISERYPNARVHLSCVRDCTAVEDSFISSCAAPGGDETKLKVAENEKLDIGLTKN